MKKTLPFFLFLAASTFSHSATLVGHWTFDETSGTTAADQTGANAGTIGSGVTVGSTGKIGNAFTFDGTNGGNVSMGNASFLSTILHSTGSSTNSYSFSAWINPSSAKGSVVYAGNDDSNSYSNIGTSGDSVRRWLRGSGGADSSSGNVVQGMWSHLVLSVTPTGSKTYLNGAELPALNETNINYGSINSANRFTIGILDRSNSGSDADFYSGLIDDVQVYTGSLSGAEVTTLFNTPGTTVPEPSALLLSALGSLALLRRKR